MLPDWDHSALEAELRLADSMMKSGGDRSSSHSASTSPASLMTPSISTPSISSLSDAAFLSFSSSFGTTQFSLGGGSGKLPARYSSSEHISAEESDSLRDELDLAATNFNSLSFLDTA